MVERGVAVVVGVRGHAEVLAESAKAQSYEGIFVSSAEDAGEWMRENLRDGDAVLLKGSRGVGLERALAKLT